MRRRTEGQASSEACQTVGLQASEFAQVSELAARSSQNQCLREALGVAEALCGHDADAGKEGPRAEYHSRLKLWVQLQGKWEAPQAVCAAR